MNNPRILHRVNGFAAALFIQLLVGCTAPETHRNLVSLQLLDRAGHPIGPQRVPGVFSLPPDIHLEKPLTDEDAVAIALWNNAAYQELLADLGLARADEILAGQFTNPTFMALFPLGPKQFEFAAKFPAEALWARKRRIAVSAHQARTTAERMVQAGLDLVRDVKVACADLRQADGNAALQRESALLLKRIADLGESRRRAGDISELGAATARVAALNADQTQSRAEADAALANARLRFLLGMSPDQPPPVLAESPLPPSQPVTRPLSDLITDALANRPDLRAAELAMESAGERVRLTRHEIYTMTAILDANGTGSDFETGPGVEFSIPIFHQNQGSTAVAKAAFEQAVRHYIAVREGIAFEVRRDHVRWTQAIDAAQRWDNQLQPELNATVAVARKGVASGDLDPLQALEAERTLNSALVNRLSAVADLHRSVAELERSIGHGLSPKTKIQSTSHADPKRP